MIELQKSSLETAALYKHLETWKALTKLTKATHTGLHSNWQFLVLC